ncbi:MAG: hypothetical protein GXO86_11795 [Chlorobi bacterium]|nr:hypothetical protein [Chlorobiota bacterium]
MRRLINRDRLFVNQWYIGSGNRVSVFTRRSKRPFDEIRELYLMEIESTTRSPHHKADISPEQRRKIRERVKKQIRKQNIRDLIKTIIALLISIGVFTGLFYLAVYLIDYFMFSE